MPLRAKYVVGFTAIAGSIALHTPAMAASFDCSHAKAPREQLICSDPALSNLDEQLERKYQERRALLSPAGVELLQRSELSWLHFIAIACPFTPSATALPPKYCLEGKYEERLTQLAHAGEKFGPFVFNRIDLYAAVAVQEDSGPVPGFSIRHIAYPQIDLPNSPQAEAWNKANAAEPSEAGDCPDGQHLIDYEIGYASQNVISMRRSESEYCGGAHCMVRTKTSNTVLLPNPRPLTEHDVFGPDKIWVEKLQGLFWSALLKQKWRPPQDVEESVKTGIMTEVIKPQRWLFTREGLSVSFDPYEGGCYACTLDPVTLSWEQLKPLLAQNAIVP